MRMRYGRQTCIYERLLTPDGLVLQYAFLRFLAGQTADAKPDIFPLRLMCSTS